MSKEVNDSVEVCGILELDVRSSTKCNGSSLNL